MMLLLAPILGPAVAQYCLAFLLPLANASGAPQRRLIPLQYVDQVPERIDDLPALHRSIIDGRVGPPVPAKG